jgi:wobble nucleotide-excising tRNase
LKRNERNGKSVDPAEVERLEAALEKSQADNATLQKQYKDLTKNFEATTNALDSESKYTRQLLIQNGLTAELSKAGVTNPTHLKAVQAMLKENVQIVVEGDARIAKIGDKALSDYVKEWAAGDEGKHFVQAPANSGGGATGGNGGGAASIKGRIDGSPVERAAYFATKFPDLTP